MKTNSKINKQMKAFSKWYNKQNNIIKAAVWVLGIVCFLAILQVLYVIVKALVWVAVIVGLGYLFMKYWKKK